MSQGKLFYAYKAKGWTLATAALLEVLLDTRDVSSVLVISNQDGIHCLNQDQLLPVYEEDYGTLGVGEKFPWDDRLIRFTIPETKEAVTLANQKHAWGLIATLKAARNKADSTIIRNLVVPFPMDEEDLKYLPEVMQKCPWVNVYIYWCDDGEKREPGLFEFTTVGESLDINDPSEPVVVTRDLWRGMRLPLGKLVTFAGESDEGKSPVTMDILARISAGLNWPGDEPGSNTEENTFGPRSAILMNIEDEYLTDTKPRIIAAGGNPLKVISIRGTKVAAGEKFDRRMLALDRDVNLLCTLARSTKDLLAIVIDPITNYLGRVRMVEEDKVRQLLTPLAQLAEELQIVVIIVAHLNKATDKNQTPMQRIMGAAAFKGVSRRIYFFGPNREVEGEDAKYEHIIVAGRSEKIDAWRYKTVEVLHEMEVKQPGGEVQQQKVPVIKIEWKGRSKATAEDAVNPITKKEATASMEAARELKNFLKAGKRTSQECTSYLLSLGYDLTKLNATKVRKHAEVSHRQEGQKSWWFLGTAQQEFEIPKARKDDDAPTY
jgi:hypothetical protein